KAETLAEGDGLERLLDARPAIVAVHGIIAAADRGDFSHANLRHFCLNFADVIQAGIGRRIATIREGVEVDAAESPAATKFQAAIQMLKQPMNARVRNDAEEMQLGAVFQGMPDRSIELGIVVKLTRADGFGDAHRFLIDDPAGADVLMAD